MDRGAASAFSADTELCLASDLLRGVEPIAAFMFGEVTPETKRRTYYLASRKYAPIGKEGATLIASKRALRGYYMNLTRSAAA